MNLMSLSDRRQVLAERFAIKCLKSDKFKDLFPENNKKFELRKEEKYLGWWVTILRMVGDHPGDGG